MSNRYTVQCGCKSPHAITREQRKYCKRALQMAYSMRDRTAIAKIKDALAPCSNSSSAIKQEEAKEALSQSSAKILISAMTAKSIGF